MPTHDAWDWPLLLYIGTVLLKRSEKEFWRMTPVKLRALTDAHIELNPTGDGSEKKQDSKPAYIDQLF